MRVSETSTVSSTEDPRDTRIAGSFARYGIRKENQFVILCFNANFHSEDRARDHCAPSRKPASGYMIYRRPPDPGIARQSCARYFVKLISSYSAFPS